MAGFKVTLTRTYTFEDGEMENEEQAVKAAIEISEQDSNWKDEDIQVEQITTNNNKYPCNCGYSNIGHLLGCPALQDPNY